MTPFWKMVGRLMARRGMVFAAIFFAFLSALGLGIGLLSLGPVLEQILHPDQGMGLKEMAEQVNQSDGFWHVPEWLTSMLPSDRFDGVLVLIIGIWILTLLGASANYLHQYLSQTLATLTIADIRRELFAHVLSMRLVDVSGRGSSAFVARIIRDSAALESGYIGLLGKSVAQISKGLAALIVAIVFDWKIVVVAVIVAPLLGAVLRAIARRIRRGAHGSLTAQQELLQLASEQVQGLRAVKTSTAEQEALDQFDSANRQVVKHELRMRIARALSSPLMETLAIVVLGGLALLAANSILSGSLPFERFLLSIGALAVAGSSFRPLAGVINDISAASAPAGRILEVLAIATESHEGTPLGPHRNAVSFEQVTYAYPGADHSAVNKVDLEIKFASHVAIVGPNGSGKTTLLSLLPRLLEPQSGVMRIDGHDLAEVSIADLRQQIGVVTQEPFMVHGSIAKNIAFGIPDASDSDIRWAAKAAHADRFIESLPQGYETMVAEQGTSLSGGQRQRLAIARAILRRPSILILDEATSQIDSESEAAIASAIREIRECTVIVIAHRLATVLDCDLIVVMDEGRIVDVGTHDELLGRCDLYARLIQTQLVAVDP